MAECKANMRESGPHGSWDLYQPQNFANGRGEKADFLLTIPGSYLRLALSKAEVLDLRRHLNTSKELPSS